MSVLTKLFVVLLIVCSLLLTAATVVFVNKTNVFQSEVDRLSLQKAKLQAEKDTAQRDADAARTREAEAVGSANTRLTEMQTKLTQIMQGMAARDNEVHALKTAGAVDKAAITEQASALKIMQQNVSDSMARLKALTEESDKLRDRNVELVGANTDYQKRVDEAERERRFLNEQLNQYKVEMASMKALIDEHHIPLTSTQRRTSRSLPELNGVIRNVKADGGQTYATISLGSADKVEKGMQFYVINQFDGNFLGNFIVDSVDTNTAFGRLEGPRVQDIKAEYMVVSKL